VEYSTSIPVASSSIDIHKTFMDTIGRPTIVLTAHNAIEDWRDRGDLVITYEYPWLAGFRKPIAIATAVFGVFFTVWVVGNIDVTIGKKT
jgi:oligosaccharyltransferase complex subunit alpha (ribophorin I)